MRSTLINSFTTIPAEIYFQLIFATILSGLIGFEREYHGRDAGLRTHILIGLGACAAMALAILFVQDHPELRLDIFRITAGVITGIGFLGAGTILKTGISAKGLASAANIWTTAIVGLLIGSGYYSIAIIVTGIILINFVYIWRFKQGLEQNGKNCEIKFTIKGEIPEKKDIEKVLYTYGFKTVRKSYTQEKELTHVNYIGKIDRRHNVYEILEHVNQNLKTESISVSEI